MYYNIFLVVLSFFEGRNHPTNSFFCKGTLLFSFMQNIGWKLNKINSKRTNILFFAIFFVPLQPN